MKLHLSDPKQARKLSDFIHGLCTRFSLDCAEVFRCDSSTRLVQGIVSADRRGHVADLSCHLYGCSNEAGDYLLDIAGGRVAYTLIDGPADHAIWSKKPYPAAVVPIRVEGAIVGLLAVDNRETGRPLPKAVIPSLLEEAGDMGPLVLPFQITQPADLAGSILNTLTDGICLMAAHGIIVHANESLMRMFGYSYSELYMQHRRFLFARYTEEGTPVSDSGTFAGEEDWEGEFYARRANGSLFPIHLKRVHLYPESGIYFWIGVVQDRTDRRALERTDRRRRASEERLRQVTRHGRCILWHSDVVDYGDYIQQPITITDEHAAQLIVPLEVPEGRTYSEVWREKRHPDDQTRAKKRALKAFREGETSYQQEFRTLNLHGVHQWLYEDVSIEPVGPGRWRAVGVCTDISEQKRIEAALSESEARYRRLVESNIVGILEGDLSGRIFSANDAFLQMVGYTREEFESRHLSWIDLTPPDYAEDDRRMVEQLRIHRATTVEEKEYLHKDGHRVPVLFGSVMLDGFETRGIAFVLDLSDRKRLEAQLMQAQKMEAVGRLAGGVAHDFNNMLSVINGCSELLLNRLPEIDPHRRHLEQVHQAGQRAADLTHQLLAFSRKQVLSPKIIDFGQTIDQIGRMLQRIIGEDIEMITRLALGIGKVKADPGQIEQVIFNLAVNARDAMPEGGSLTLETDEWQVNAGDPSIPFYVQPGSYIALRVSDTGVGMSQETLLHLFEPFFTTKPQGEGTGLGLATVYGIVKQSGGYIWAKSDPGSGAVFTVLLPRAYEEDEAPSDPGPAEYRTGVETILLVEDESMVREIVREVLEECGYQLLEASRGEEAIEIVRGHEGPIHLLLTDVIMPGGVSGPALVEQVEQWRPEAAVLFMSGYTGDEVMHRGMHIDTINFLQKPFSPQALADKVRAVLDSKVGRTAPANSPAGP